ncbi:restriction endonuclease subunit S [Roseburia sp. 499]|uniref:restriction endonuclease subunit S n=1 Tax=Roseburia sp. 499 TaxID=1261634 RepID=UPI0009529E36|nr:restriction endonuclease subunit S [Roseburia sp. 499]WVK70429.1 restriction endonuclease subunit S [Roseburia sp. 499]
MAEWNEYTVADVISTVIDYRGKTPKKLGGDWSESGYRALSAKNIKTGKIVQPDSIRYVSEEMYRCWMKEEVQKGDILITSEAPFGQIYYWDSDEKIVLSQRLFAVRVNNTFYPKYIYFYMTSSFFQAELDGRATGTTVVGLRQPELLKCKIYAPDYQEQKRIADTLWCIEQKINNNELINNNLEQQAQAIYHQMFIENRNSNWKEGNLSDLVSVKYGKDHKKLDDGCYPVYGSGGIMRYVEKPLYTGESVLIPRKGTLNNVMYVNGAFWSVDTMFYTEMLRPNIAKFVYHFVKGKDLASLNAGSAVPSMTTNILNAMQLYIPDDVTLCIFEETVAPMYSQMQENEKQSVNLAKLRDTLLPRLMSGELDVSDIEL